MADIYKSLAERNQTEAARAARQARRQARQEQVYSQIGEAIRDDNTHAQRFSDIHRRRAFDINRPTSDERELATGLHPGDSALGLVNEALTQYKVSGTMRLRYGGMDRKAGKGGHGIDEGTIFIEAELKPVAGMTSFFTVPVIVRQGKMLYPSILVTSQGNTRVIAQSTFDELMGYAEVDQTIVTDRQPFDSPIPPSKPRRRSSVDIDAIRRAMRSR